MERESPAFIPTSYNRQRSFRMLLIVFPMLLKICLHACIKAGIYWEFTVYQTLFYTSHVYQLFTTLLGRSWLLFLFSSLRETDPEKCAQCHISRKWQNQDIAPGLQNPYLYCWNHKEHGVFVLFCLT